MANHSDRQASGWVRALLLMRIPFSVFLMPVYWFALIPVEVNVTKAVMAFVAIHVFLYPASNGYNSWFDRDEESIGGLKRPPKVSRELWYLIIIFDVLSLLLASEVNVAFAALLFVYMMVSKAYSYDRIRLKKYPVTGALTVVTFQGFWIYLAVQVAAADSDFLSMRNTLFRIVSSLFLLGSYPMTQIYQHGEDSKRGDRSLSLMLGLHGTFIFGAVIFFVASALMIYLFAVAEQWTFIIVYLIALIPVNGYFLRWYGDFRKGKPVITHRHTMRLNQISSLSLSVAFIVMKLLK
jgi:1,4-dihydroxy-2-naphthoate octaprenyltransferase